MLRIVHVITRFVNGGADENTLLTCNHQAEAGHKVWLVYGREFTERMAGQLDPRVERVALPRLVREVSPLNDTLALARLASMLRRIKPDIVHTHTSKAGIIGRAAAFAVPRARVVHGVHILPFTGESAIKRAAYILMERIAAMRTDAFIDVSEGMRDLCLAHSLGREDDHFVIRSGMDIERFRRATPPEDLVSLRHNTGAQVLIGYVAVLERRKRHRELLRAISALLRRQPQAHLLFAGAGPEEDILRKIAEDEGVGAQVHFLGFREDIDRLLAACDICVFASEREGLPRSLVQYGLAGKPIIAMHLPGIEHVLRDGWNGYLVEAEAFDEFGKKLELLVRDPSIRETMASNSKRIDFSEWDATRMTDRISMVYSRIGAVPSPVS
ncbi:glycosyltransferase family 4 protein [Parvibaculum sp.]|uniref:glycosyltransferase family 4 protein n=1 Tax=Parvibaculum sp. TaxID=2024848 RepID=UPI003BABBF07